MQILNIKNFISVIFKTYPLSKTKDGHTKNKKINKIQIQIPKVADKTNMVYSSGGCG